MATDWDTADARAQLLTARREAQLIRDPAASRARKAAKHPAACRCVACRIRHWDDIRTAAVASCHRQLTHGGTHA